MAYNYITSPNNPNLYLPVSNSKEKHFYNYVGRDNVSIFDMSFEWRDCLILDDYYKGRSCVHINCTSCTNYTKYLSSQYTMFFTDFFDLIKTGKISYGSLHHYTGTYDKYAFVEGTWKFVKRGQNFGVKLVD